VRERVIGDQMEAAGDVSLYPQHERVVAGAIVGPKNRGRERIGAIGVVPFFVRVVRTYGPIGIECMLDAGRRVECVRRFVIWIDQGGRRVGSPVYSLQGGSPSVLCQVVVKQSEAGSDDGVAAIARE